MAPQASAKAPGHFAAKSCGTLAADCSAIASEALRKQSISCDSLRKVIGLTALFCIFALKQTRLDAT